MLTPGQSKHLAKRLLEAPQSAFAIGDSVWAVHFEQVPVQSVVVARAFFCTGPRTGWYYMTSCQKEEKWYPEDWFFESKDALVNSLLLALSPGQGSISAAE
ncbi:hypothetical protein GCM10028807_06690 [Spirosoma daeguense]